MGAAFVSPFIGWKEANGKDTIRFINEIVAVRDNYGFETEIIVCGRAQRPANRRGRHRRRRHRHSRAARVQGSPSIIHIPLKG